MIANILYRRFFDYEQSRIVTEDDDEFYYIEDEEFYYIEGEPLYMVTDGNISYYYSTTGILFEMHSVGR